MVVIMNLDMVKLKAALMGIADLCEIRNLQLGASPQAAEALVKSCHIPATDELKDYFLQCVPSKPFGWTLEFHSLATLQEAIRHVEPSLSLFLLGFVPLAEEGDGNPICYSLRSKCMLLLDFTDFSEWTEVERRASKSWRNMEHFFLYALRASILNE